MEGSVNNFFELIDPYLVYLSFLFFLGGLIALIFYYGKKFSIKRYKLKYDYISKNEIKVLWYVALLWLIALVVYPWNIISDEMALSHFVDLFIEISLATIAGMAIYYTLQIYYPSYLNNQLKRLRYKPRKSPKTGKPMKLLTEEEEDVYLDEGMQAEEEVFSIDYDVWIDEETGYTEVEKYSGKNTAIKCPNCGYQTLKVEKEELLIAPTAYTSGELLKRYKCSYCNHKMKEIFTVAKLKEEK